MAQGQGPVAVCYARKVSRGRAEEAGFNRPTCKLLCQFLDPQRRVGRSRAARALPGVIVLLREDVPRIRRADRVKVALVKD